MYGSWKWVTARTIACARREFEVGGGTLSFTGGFYASRQDIDTDWLWTSHVQTVEGNGNAVLVDIVNAAGDTVNVQGHDLTAEAVPLRWTPRGAVRARILTPDSATYRITMDGRTLARGTAVRDEEVAVRAAPAERGSWAAPVAMQARYRLA